MASTIEWLLAGLAVYLRQLGQPESAERFVDEYLEDAVTTMALGDFIGAGFNITYAAMFEKQDRTGELIPPDAFLGIDLDPQDPEPFTSMEFARRHPRMERLAPMSEDDVGSLPSQLKTVAVGLLSVVAEQHPEARLSELTSATVEAIAERLGVQVPTDGVNGPAQRFKRSERGTWH